MVLKKGQRHPTEAESRRAARELGIWQRSHRIREPAGLRNYDVDVFEPRGVSEFIWQDGWDHNEGELGPGGWAHSRERSRSAKNLERARELVGEASPGLVILDGEDIRERYLVWYMGLVLEHNRGGLPYHGPSS